MLYIFKKLFLFFSCLGIVFDANAQCVSINLPDTVHACANSQVSLSPVIINPSNLTMLDTFWTPGASLSNADIINPIATLGTSGANYVLHIQAITAASLVVNGDFSNGTAGLNSGYVPGTGGSWGLLSNEGTYAVTTDPFLAHINFASFGDHTSGSGQMMVVNGAATANVSVWCQTIPVLPNTDYDFSTWVASCVTSNPAVLQFSINNQLLNTPFSLSSTTALWEQFHAVWNSGNNTTATICITNQNTDPSGNDFAIDDIAFREICIATDSVYIAINKFSYEIESSIVPCEDGKINFHAHDLGSNIAATSLEWNFGDGQIGTGSSIDHVYTSWGTYYVTLVFEDAYGCKDSTFKLTEVTNFKTPISIMQDTSICNGASLTLSVEEGDTYQWSPVASLNDPSVQHPVATPQATTTYSVIIHKNGCDQQADVTVTILALPEINIDDPSGIITCHQPSIQLHVSGTSQYEWSPASLCDNAFGASPIVSPSKTTMFIVKGTDINNCISSDSVLITVVAESSIFVPTVFTPNGDGKNDIIKPIPNCGVKVIDFEIYNRWGEKIFQTYGKEGWDGSYLGVPADIGTYFYYLKGITIDGKQVVSKGNLTLLK